jgi:hypothetical protein
VRQTIRRLEFESARLAELLTKSFLQQDGAWPLTPEQERQYHEVQAALAAGEAERHRRLVPGAGERSEA